MRFDYNVTDKHRVSVTYNHFFEDRGADHLNGGERRFPDSPNYSVTTARRPSRSFALRSTLSNSLVNELRFGITRGRAHLLRRADVRRAANLHRHERLRD